MNTNTLQKIIGVVEKVSSEGRPFSVKDICEQTLFSRTTVYSVLRALARARFLRYSKHPRYKSEQWSRMSKFDSLAQPMETKTVEDLNWLLQV